MNNMLNFEVYWLSLFSQQAFLETTRYYKTGRVGFTHTQVEQLWVAITICLLTSMTYVIL